MGERVAAAAADGEPLGLGFAERPRALDGRARRREAEVAGETQVGDDHLERGAAGLLQRRLALAHAPGGARRGEQRERAGEGQQHQRGGHQQLDQRDAARAHQVSVASSSRAGCASPSRQLSSMR